MESRMKRPATIPTFTSAVVFARAGLTSGRTFATTGDEISVDVFPAETRDLPKDHYTVVTCSILSRDLRSDEGSFEIVGRELHSHLSCTPAAAWKDRVESAGSSQFVVFRGSAR